MSHKLKVLNQNEVKKQNKVKWAEVVRLKVYSKLIS